MVTVKHEELKIAYDAIMRIVEEVKQQKVAPRLMMKLRRMARAAEPITIDLEKERDRLLKMYAQTEKGELVTEEEGTMRRVKFESNEKVKEFLDAFSILMAEECEQPEQLTADELEGVKITGELVYQLGPLLKE